MDLLPFEDRLRLASILKRLKSSEFRRRYAFVFGLLRKEAVSPSGWGLEARRRMQDGLFSQPIFPRTDSVRNILSNKLTALFRFEAKDVADIREICKNYEFSWPSVVDEGRTKEAGLEAPLAAEILLGIPESDFLSVRWSRQPAWDDFRADISVIVSDLTLGNENSLCRRTSTQFRS